MQYQNALITGASSGLGRGLAVYFAKKGVKVFAAARRSELLQSLKDEVGSEGVIEPVELDVANANETIARIRQLDETSGGLDLIIANAGVGLDTSGKRIKWENVERTIQVNVMGSAATLTAVIPQMVSRGKGHLVGIASIAAFRGLPRSASYSASKAFLSTFLESLRIDLKPTGVKVSCIYPGWVKTDLTAKNKFKMPFLLETDDAVNRMGRAIERGAANYVFPFPLSVAMRTASTLPRPLYEAAIRQLGG
jgi:short-subunit dehydrogenase